MADVIQIVVDVDDKDILRTIQNHERLEKRVEQLNKEYKHLDKLFNENKISAQAYAKAVAQVDAEINKLSTVMRKGGKEMEALATGMNISGKASRRMEVGFQQAGYQLQDFIVQVQGGTNPLIAFSQQGSQLAGFFAGPWGAMIGLGIAAVSSLAMAFLATSEDAEQLQKNLDKIKDNLGNFQDKVKEAEETVSSFGYAMAQVQKTQIEAAWSDLGESTADAFQASFMAKFGLALKLGLMGELDGWSKASGILAGDNFAKAFGEGAEKSLNNETLKNIEKYIKDKNVEMLDSTIKGLSMFSGMTEQGAEFLEYLIRIRDEAAGYTEEVKKAAKKVEEALDSGKDLAKLDLSLGVEAAAAAARYLAEQLGISVKEAEALINLASTGPDLGVFGGAGDSRFDKPQTLVFGPWEEPKKKRSGGGGGKTPAQQLEEYLQKAEKEVALKRKQVGLTESQARAIELETKFLEAKVPLDKARIDALVAEEEALRKATEAEDRRKSMVQTFEGIMENAFMSMVDGSQSVEDAFKGMLRSILLEIYRQQVAKPLASGIMQILGFSAKGDVISNGSYVKAFANGGVVTGPTAFPMQGGVGVMGEAGPEAIMPLKRGANGKLGVEMHGGGGDTINVVQNFSFSANGDESVKKIIAQAAPQIAQMTQQKIMDSRRRGGQMKSVFS